MLQVEQQRSLVAKAPFEDCLDATIGCRQDAAIDVHATDAAPINTTASVAAVLQSAMGRLHKLSSHIQGYTNDVVESTKPLFKFKARAIPWPVLWPLLMAGPFL